MARIGPNSFFASASRAKTIVDAILHVGDEQNACSKINPSTTPGPAPRRIAVLASAIAIAVARANHLNTFTGEAWRSATAPNNNGDTNAATPEVANAYGRMWAKPWASSTELSGTNHMLSAAPWRRKRPMSSAYSARRMVVSTRGAHTAPP